MRFKKKSKNKDNPILTSSKKLSKDENNITEKRKKRVQFKLSDDERPKEARTDMKRKTLELVNSLDARKRALLAYMCLLPDVADVETKIYSKALKKLAQKSTEELHQSVNDNVLRRSNQCKPREMLSATKRQSSKTKQNEYQSEESTNFETMLKNINSVKCLKTDYSKNTSELNDLITLLQDRLQKKIALSCKQAKNCNPKSLEAETPCQCNSAEYLPRENPKVGKADDLRQKIEVVSRDLRKTAAKMHHSIQFLNEIVLKTDNSGHESKDEQKADFVSVKKEIKGQIDVRASSNYEKRKVSKPQSHEKTNQSRCSMTAAHPEGKDEKCDKIRQNSNSAPKKISNGVPQTSSCFEKTHIIANNPLGDAKEYPINDALSKVHIAERNTKQFEVSGENYIIRKKNYSRTTCSSLRNHTSIKSTFEIKSNISNTICDSVVATSTVKNMEPVEFGNKRSYITQWVEKSFVNRQNKQKNIMHHVIQRNKEIHLGHAKLSNCNRSSPEYVSDPIINHPVANSCIKSKIGPHHSDPATYRDHDQYRAHKVCRTNRSPLRTEKTTAAVLEENSSLNSRIKHVMNKKLTYSPPVEFTPLRCEAKYDSREIAHTSLQLGDLRKQFIKMQSGSTYRDYECQHKKRVH